MFVVIEFQAGDTGEWAEIECTTGPFETEGQAFNWIKDKSSKGNYMDGGKKHVDVYTRIVPLRAVYSS